MKKLIGLTVILVALILGSYGVTGLITEDTLKKSIGLIDQSNGMTVTISEYHRGWFESNALLDLQLNVPEHVVTNTSGQVTTVAAREYKTKMPLKIMHGPVIVVDSKVLFGLGYAKSNMLLPEPYAEQFKQTFTEQSTTPKLNLSIFVNYLNKISFRMELPTFKLIYKDGSSQFEWLGMNSDIDISSNREHVNGQITLDGVNLLKDRVSAILGKVTTVYRLNRTDSDLYLGDADVSVSSLVLKESDVALIDLQSLDINSSSNISNNLFNSSLNFKLTKLILKDKTYGPMAIDISLKNLDAIVLGNMNKQAIKMQQGTYAERHQAILSLVPELPKLFSKGAIFEVPVFNLVMPEGIVKGNVLVTLPAADLGNPFQLIQKTKGNGKIEIAKPVFKRFLNDYMIKNQSLSRDANAASSDATPVVDPSISMATQVDDKIAFLIKTGALADQDKFYVIELNLSEGHLLVNGKPFNQDMLQF